MKELSRLVTNESARVGSRAKGSPCGPAHGGAMLKNTIDRMCNFRNAGLQLLLLCCATVASAAPACPTPAVAHVARGVGPGQGVARRRPTSHEPDSDLCRLVSNESGP